MQPPPQSPPPLDPADLDPEQKRVLAAILERTAISRDIHQDLQAHRTFGERLADRIAAFGGSWTFILVFLGLMATWIALNIIRVAAFDPYPFILLNLFLSMTAALQAPVILMSQNRQGARDRADAAHDYEVNLKAELEIRMLHEKLDLLREKQWSDLVAIQQRQMELLERLLASETRPLSPRD